MKQLLALGLVLAACSIERPSEALKCASQTDCASFPDTVCESGYCVRGGNQPPVDAAPIMADAFVCPAACNGGCDPATTPPTCTINGTGSGVTCPPGMRCNITCATAGACTSISCQGATCDVTCSVTNACGNLTCTTGDCTRTCQGEDACGAMTCNGGACTQTCSGGQLACGPMSCGAGKCTATCMGIMGACDDVDCAGSCECNVTCDDFGGNVCPDMTCPDPNGGGLNECEDTFGRCDSSRTPNRCREC